MKENVSLNDMVILYRTNAQSRAFEDGLLKSNIPYKIVGGVNFYSRREIKDVLAYLAAEAKKHTEDPYSEYFNLIGQMVDLCDSYAQMKSEISITKELEERIAQEVKLSSEADRRNSPELSELEAKTGRLTAQCAEIEQNFNDIKETVKELDGILF